MRATRRIAAVLVVFGLGLAAGLLPAVLAQAPGIEDDLILFEPAMSVGPDPFTAPATSASGPFGGSGSDEVCDPELLIRFLQDHPDRLRAWASVQGIEPREVPDFIRSLRPVVLAEDTRVTNHGFKAGSAYPFQSMLERGTTVLVDEDGKPVVRCRCGNPLDKPRCEDEDCDKREPGCPEHLVAVYGEDCIPDERECPTHLIALYGEDCVPDEECPQGSSIHGYNPDCPPPPPPPGDDCTESHILGNCGHGRDGDRRPEPQPEPEQPSDEEPERPRPEPEDEPTSPPSIVGHN